MIKTRFVFDGTIGIGASITETGDGAIVFHSIPKHEIGAEILDFDNYPRSAELIFLSEKSIEVLIKNLELAREAMINNAKKSLTASPAGKQGE